MLVTALCTECFSRAKINKKLWPSYFKIWPPYFECSGAGSGSDSAFCNLAAETESGVGRRNRGSQRFCKKSGLGVRVETLACKGVESGAVEQKSIPRVRVVWIDFASEQRAKFIRL